MSEAEAAPSTGLSVDSVRIMQMIPHRPPFLMIDRVYDLVADKGAIGVKNVSMTEPHFEGISPAPR